MNEADRLPPHDNDAEEAAIGSLLIDGAAIHRIASFLRPADFYGERTRWIYEAALALSQRDEAIDQITVAQELDHRKKLEDCGGSAYLSRLISVVPTSLDIEHYAQIVYRLAVMRYLISAGNQITAIGYDADPDVEKSLSKAEDTLFKLRHGQTQRDFVHIRQVLDQYFDETTAKAEEAERPKLPYIRSGFHGLDDFLGGLQRSDLVIVAGRPSMGKTSLALNIARNAAVDQGACVAMFSLEMAREALVLRLLSSESSVNLKQVRLGLHSDRDESRIMDAIGVLSEAPLYIDDSPQLRVLEMRSKARRLFYEHGIDLIIVDYLQLMYGEGRDEVEKISNISRSLKAIARELNVPMIAVSQMSRAAEWRASHRPQLSDLRGSGSIEQDADVVLFVYRDEYYFTKEQWEREHPDDVYPQGIADVIVAKHRNGPTGQTSLRFISKLAKFDNIAHQTADEEPSLP